MAVNVGVSKHTAGGTEASIARLLGFLTSSPAKVVSAGVDDNGALYFVVLVSFLRKDWQNDITYSQHTLGTDQFDQLVLNGAHCVALSIGLEVA